MPLLDLADFKSRLPPGCGLMGIDYGSKQIGLAVSDPGLTLASPLQVVPRGKLADFVALLQKHMAERQIGGLILGLPLTLDGQTGPMAQSVRTLASNLEKAFSPLMAFWDERFSTAVIQRELIERADLSRARRAEVIDKLAAAYQLQGALDYLTRGGVGSCR